jgi:hypothetical protein
MLAKGLKGGDVVYVGPKETLVKSGVAVYSMPSAAKAQKDFPLETITALGKTKQEAFAEVEGGRFADLVTDCASCLGQLARTEVLLSMATVGDKLTISAKNGGALFRGVLPLLSTTGDRSFHVPLEGMVQVLQFVGQKVVFSLGKHGDLFMTVDAGWVLFPAWAPKAK